MPQVHSVNSEPFMICGEDFNTAYGDVIDNAYMRMFVDRINSHLQDAFDYLAPVRDNIQSTLTYKNQLKALNETLPEDYKNDRYWGYVVSNLLCNHYVADIAIQEIFTGYTFEFKNALDWAKRASQGVRPGSTTRSNTTYTQIVVSDVNLIKTLCYRRCLNHLQMIKQLLMNLIDALVLRLLQLPMLSMLLHKMSVLDVSKLWVIMIVLLYLLVEL